MRTRKGVRGLVATVAVAAIVMASTGTAIGATRSISAVLSVPLGADGACHPTTTMSWNGYQVRATVVDYAVDGQPAWHDYHTMPTRPRVPGTVVSTAGLDAGPGSSWTAHVIFIGTNYEHIADLDLPAVAAPLACG
jgi:hypothetical protein